jgi:membrane protease YdiL (CAAX protease family)
MSGQPTRAGPSPDVTNASRRLRIPARWRSFGAFLRRPSLPDRAELSLAKSVRWVVPLFALDMLLMAVVLGGFGIATALGFELPAHVLDDMTLTPGLLLLMIFVLPVGEEIIFRGWVSGRPGHIAGSILVVPVVFAVLAAVASRNPAVGAVAAVFAALAIGAVWALRKKDAWRFFQRHFAWFYYASALLFAAMHLTNFAGAGMSAAMLPLVLPQLMLGLILGYLRVHRGLMTGAAVHVLHNGIFAALMLAGVDG